MTTTYDVSGNPDPEAAALELIVRYPATSCTPTRSASLQDYCGT